MAHCGNAAGQLQRFLTNSPSDCAPERNAGGRRAHAKRKSLAVGFAQSIHARVTVLFADPTVLRATQPMAIPEPHRRAMQQWRVTS